MEWIKFSEREPEWGYPDPHAEILICNIGTGVVNLTEIFLYKKHANAYKKRYTHWALVTLP